MDQPTQDKPPGLAPKSRTNWTIHDIAAGMGVSAKTVSRVVNDAPGVGPELRQRIQAFIREVGYHPHIGARSMRGTPTDAIGIMTPAPMSEVPLSQTFFLWLFQEVYRIFASHGYFVCFDLNPYESARATDYARGLWEQRFGACLILGPLRTDDPTIARIHRHGVPYVAYGRLDSVPEMNYATVDYEEGAYQSTRYLIKRGHTRIAMLKAFEGYQPAVERRRGYLRAMEEAGIEADESLIRATTFASPQIAHSVHSLLGNGNVTALVDCSAAEDAESLREGARLAGRSLGNDVELVTWTYTDNATVQREACAHAWLPVREAALEGMEQLMRRIEAKSNDAIQILLPPKLRENSGAQEIAKPIPLFSPHD
jgi:LacI family transcriptional regulator